MRRRSQTVEHITRSDPMKSSKRKTRAARSPVRNSAARKAVAGKAGASKRAKEIVQFAPNFTAYVLPPATVCLYSEHRKFFLHGELYVAIAEAIGKNGKDTQLI